MHIGPIHVDPSVLAHQGLGRAHGEEHGPRAHGHGPGAGHAFSAVLAQQASHAQAHSGQHLAAVHASRQRGPGRRGQLGDPEAAHYRADDHAYAEAMHDALGHARPLQHPMQVSKLQSMVMASLGRMNLHYEPNKDDDDE